jgi:hypothetical protein
MCPDHGALDHGTVPPERNSNGRQPLPQEDRPPPGVLELDPPGRVEKINAIAASSLNIPEAALLVSAAIDITGFADLFNEPNRAPVFTRHFVDTYRDACAQMDVPWSEYTSLGYVIGNDMIAKINSLDTTAWQHIVDVILVVHDAAPWGDPGRAGVLYDYLSPAGFPAGPAFT